MTELTNEEMNSVSGGAGPLIVLIAVIKYEKQISDLMQGFLDGVIEARSRHQ